MHAVFACGPVDPKQAVSHVFAPHIFVDCLLRAKATVANKTDLNKTEGPSPPGGLDLVGEMMRQALHRVQRRGVSGAAEAEVC